VVEGLRREHLGLIRKTRFLNVARLSLSQEEGLLLTRDEREVSRLGSGNWSCPPLGQENQTVRDPAGSFWYRSAQEQLSTRKRDRVGDRQSLWKDDAKGQKKKKNLLRTVNVDSAL